MFRVTPTKLQDYTKYVAAFNPKETGTTSLSYPQSLATIPNIIIFLKRCGLPYVYGMPLPSIPRDITVESLRRILMLCSCICTKSYGSDISGLTIHNTMMSSTKDELVSAFDFHGDSLEVCLEHLEMYFKSILRVCPEEARSVAMFINIPEAIGKDVHAHLVRYFGDAVRLNGGRSDACLIEVALPRP